MINIIHSQKWLIKLWWWHEKLGMTYMHYLHEYKGILSQLTSTSPCPKSKFSQTMRRTGHCDSNGNVVILLHLHSLHFMYLHLFVISNNNIILIPLALKCFDIFWVEGDQGHQTLFSLIQFFSNHCESLLDILPF